MPKTDKSLCSVCDLVKYKYKCPNDGVPYCSVKCFQEHKDQTHCPGKRPPSIVSNGIDKNQDTSASTGTLETCSVKPSPETKLKPLSELCWPVIDEEKMAVFYDPMRKDEVKPIRQHEWETIATSTVLRNLLINKPDLKVLLSQIHQKSNDSSKSLKDQIKQLLLQPDQAESSFSSTQNVIFNQFADIIKDILVKSRT